MTDTLNAWVWVHYRGVVSDSGASETDRMKGEGYKLWMIEEVAGTNYYMFTFRRPLPRQL